MNAQESASASNAWLALFVAGLLEMSWAIGLKYSQGFTRLAPSAFTVVALVLGMYLLSFAVKTLPIGTAYSVWVGIGSFGTVVLGGLLFQEAITPSRAFFLVLLFIAVLGLKVTGA